MCAYFGGGQEGQALSFERIRLHDLRNLVLQNIKFKKSLEVNRKNEETFKASVQSFTVSESLWYPWFNKIQLYYVLYAKSYGH